MTGMTTLDQMTMDTMLVREMRAVPSLSAGMVASLSVRRSFCLSFVPCLGRGFDGGVSCFLVAVPLRLISHGREVEFWTWSLDLSYFDGCVLFLMIRHDQYTAVSLISIARRVPHVHSDGPSLVVFVSRSKPYRLFISCDFQHGNATLEGQ